MDYLTGGDLRYHICRQIHFTEEQTKFFIACLVLGLEYCHTNNIIHRDIKPENLVLDNNGYVKITDFGIAKPLSKDNAHETSGTPGYMAPEVLCALNHGCVVDYFALGVIGYEFMKGERPYLGRNRKEIKEKILSKQVQVKKSNIPQDWSIDAADFINKTLQRKPANRLGLRGAIEIKEHSWFKYYHWRDLYQRKMKSPFIPKKGDNFDAKYCNKKEQLGANTLERYALYKKNGRTIKDFKDFLSFNREENEEDNKVSNYHLLKFRNPHDVYNDEQNTNNNANDKNSHIDSGSTIFNRNMLSNKSTDDEQTDKIRGKFQSCKNLIVNSNSELFKVNESQYQYKGLFIKRKHSNGLNDSLLSQSYMHKNIPIERKKYC